jgi:hypothetical protein
MLVRSSSHKIPSNDTPQDRIAQPRGFAIKVFNVSGPIFEAGRDIPTQDIEFNSTPALDLANAQVTKEIIDLRIKYGGDQPTLYKHLDARTDTDLQKFRDQVRNTHLESTRFYSQTAYRFGDYVAKYCLAPSSETQRKLYEETVKPDEHESDILHKWLQNFHAEHDAEYLLQFQLCENLEDQPVEYAGKELEYRLPAGFTSLLDVTSLLSLCIVTIVRASRCPAPHIKVVSSSRQLSILSSLHLSTVSTEGVGFREVPVADCCDAGYSEAGELRL